MTVKKLLILSAAGIVAVASTAFAGGPDGMGPPPPPSLFAPAIYVDAHGGYAFYDQSRFKAANGGGSIWFDQASISKSQGGWIGGLDVGLQIFKNMAVEVGGFYLPQITGNVNSSQDVTTPLCDRGGNGVGTTGSCLVGTQWNWMGYVAGRFNIHVPYADGLDAFVKVGAGWRAMSNQQHATPKGNAGMHSYWTVVYGAGMSYEIAQSGWNLGVQWMHIPSNLGGTNNGSAGENDAANHSKIAARQPAYDLVTGSIGYRLDF